MTFAARVLHRMDVGDRNLLVRWVIAADDHRPARRFWIAVTHTGGASATIGAVLAPAILGGRAREAAGRAAAALVISHLIVQVVKRSISRQRPAMASIIQCPDQFSLPSGHATAALAVAAAYAVAFPGAAALLVTFAFVVGWSRVILGVHYPGDVLVGQIIAIATVGVVQALLPG